MKHNDHGLSTRIVYGPLTSRRYGRTRGVNLLPAGVKRCDWNCVYCQLGTTAYTEAPDGFPTVAEVVQALEQTPTEPALDALVICGNGEPTLHPHFPEAIDGILQVARRRFPATRVVCLTNGQGLWRPDIVRALRRLDETAVKLDAGTCDLLARVNLPIRPACVTHQVRGIKRLHGGVVQSCFFEGGVSNTHRAAVDAWLDAVGRGMPRRVDLYTIARDTPSGKLRPARDDTLAAIAHRVRTELDIPARAYGTHAEIPPTPARTRQRPGGR